MVNVYISKQRQAAIDASGKTILQLIDLGLRSLDSRPPSLTEQVLGEFSRASCKHPPARRAKGLCMACGTYVG